MISRCDCISKYRHDATAHIATAAAAIAWRRSFYCVVSELDLGSGLARHDQRRAIMQPIAHGDRSLCTPPASFCTPSHLLKYASPALFYESRAAATAAAAAAAGNVPLNTLSCSPCYPRCIRGVQNVFVFTVLNWEFLYGEGEGWENSAHCKVWKHCSVLLPDCIGTLVHLI